MQIKKEDWIVEGLCGYVPQVSKIFTLSILSMG